MRILWVGIFWASIVVCPFNAWTHMTNDRLVYPEFNSIEQWSKNIEAIFPSSRMVWLSDFSEYFLGACIYKDSFFVCIYPKKPASAVQYFRALGIWEMETVSGQSIIGPPATISDPQLGQKIISSDASGDYHIKIFYYGTRVNLPPNHSETIRLIFPEFKIKFLIKEKYNVVKILQGSNI